MSKKLIVGCISGAGALGGAVTGSYYLLNKETEKTPEVTLQQNQPSEEDVPKEKPKQKLRELIGGDFEALDTNDGADTANWKILITKYNADPTPENKIKAEGEITKNTDDDNVANVKILQKACKTLLDKTDNIDENDKTIAKNWCNKNSTLIKAK